MTFDNLTIAGVLLTLPYIALLMAFARHKATSKRDTKPVAWRFTDEPYRYGTGGGVNAQSEYGSCTSCT